MIPSPASPPTTTPAPASAASAASATPVASAASAASAAKSMKPDQYNGADNSLSAVRAWTYRVKTYVKHSPENEQTEIAASYLSGPAEKWFVTNYSDDEILPNLPEFLDAFRKHFARADDHRYIRKEVESMTQDRKTVSEYGNDFKSLIAGLGKNVDLEWAKIHFERGLKQSIQLAIAHSFTDDDTIDTMISKAQRSAEVHQRWKESGVLSNNSARSTTYYTKPKTTPTTNTSSSKTPITPKSATSATPKREKITQPERDFLSANNGCFFCRKTNAGHMSNECPELKIFQERKAKKEAEVNAMQFQSVDAMDIGEDCSKSPCKQPVTPKSWPKAPAARPPILVNVKVQNVCTPAIIDTGATTNAVSVRLVKEQQLRTQPSQPIHILQPLTSHRNIVVNTELISKIDIPSKSWTSKQPHQFTVVPLQRHDVILGLPFLAAEGIIVDAAEGDIIIPENNTNLATLTPDPTPKTLAENPRPWLFSAPLRSQTKPLLPYSNTALPFLPYSKTDPSTSPKSTIIKTTNISSQIHQHATQLDASVNSLSTAPTSKSNPKDTIKLEVAKQLHDQLIKEFHDVFTNKLPSQPPPPNAPQHRIELIDEKKTINGRMYRVATRYWKKMNDFLQGHLQAKRIRPSSSHIASGTWMIPKKDPLATPRVVHDYRDLNANTVKDHTPLPRQDEILELMAKAMIRGKIDLINAYYQIPMRECDIYKTAFKTPFGMFEWNVMPQGLCNAPVTFQRYMNWVLRKYVGRICAVYIDDISIWSNSIEEHIQNVHLIL